MKIIELTTTFPKEEQATKCATAAIELRNAACAQILKCSSIFHWQGVKKEEEIKIIFKTTPSKYKALISQIQIEHPYKIPQIIFHKIKSKKNYKKWIKDYCK